MEHKKRKADAKSAKKSIDRFALFVFLLLCFLCSPDLNLRPMRLLTRSDVRQSISMREAVEVVKRAFSSRKDEYIFRVFRVFLCESGQFDLPVRQKIFEIESGPITSQQNLVFARNPEVRRGELEVVRIHLEVRRFKSSRRDFHFFFAYQ